MTSSMVKHRPKPFTAPYFSSLMLLSNLRCEFHRSHRVMKRKAVAAALSVLLVTAAPAGGSEPADRPEEWAHPVHLVGVPNLHRINDKLYRSAQPTEEGMSNLKQLGVKTIVNLRSFHSDRDEIGDTGLRYEHLTMKAWHPEEKEVVRFLRIVNDPESTPVLFHCLHGADRTGTLSAVYRVAVQGWSKKDALEEMVRGGFNYHEIWINLPEWIRDLDIDKIRKESGIE